MIEQPPEGEPLLTGRNVVAYAIFAGLLFLLVWVLGDIAEAELWTGILTLAVPAAVLVLLPVWWFGSLLLSWRRARRLRRDRELESTGRCVKCEVVLGDTDETCPRCTLPVWRPRDPLTGKVITRAPQRGS